MRLALSPSRLLQTLVIAAAAFAGLGASDPAGRYDKLGHQMMCTCSCAQILAECNHVGCPNSSGMLAALRTSIARGDSDRVIFAAFQAKYGPTALASPMLTRFNAVAWVVPPAVLAFGLVGAIVLIRRWKTTHTAKAPVVSPLPLTPREAAVQSRIRRETEL